MRRALQFLLLCPLLVFVACSALTQNQKKSASFGIKPITEKRYCEQGLAGIDKSIPLVASSNVAIVKEFSHLKTIMREKKVATSFIDDVVLWSLLQMNIRPDASSPSSRFQLLIHLPKEQSYFDFQASQLSPYPFLAGLDTLLKRYNSKHTLEQLAKLIEENISSKLEINEELVSFLRPHANQLEKQEIFKNTFFKDTDLLKKEETLPRLAYTRIIKDYREKITKLPSPVPLTQLYPYSQESNSQIECNYDPSKYEHNIFLSAQLPSPSQQTFSLFTHAGQSFLGVTNQNITSPKPLFNSFLIEGDHSAQSQALCFISTPKLDISILSSRDRDPGQHIHHLISSSLTSAETLEDFDQKNIQGRHLFLSNPLRLIYESYRGTKEQLKELLKLNVPVYHIESIGHIWANLHSKEGQTLASGLVLDERHFGHLNCK